MTSTATSTVREWSTPEKTKITGEPPGPDARVSHTSRGEFRRQDLQMINPIYKTDQFTSGLPVGGTSIHIKKESRLEPITGQAYPDYKVEKEKDSYRLHIIDPKVDVHSNLPAFQNLPAYLRKRNKTPDFPSAHSKRSFLKLDPLEYRRLKTYETKIISPHEYLSESVERHRSVSMSPLRDRLNMREKDVNLPWDPSTHPGPKRDDLHWLKTQKTTDYRRISSEADLVAACNIPKTNTRKQELLNDLNELAKRRERLFDRSKNRSASNIRELRKVDVDYIDLPEREYFEDTRSSKSSGRDLIRSQSMMSTEWDMYDKHTSKTRSQLNLASWQFNNANFSPRSVISVNGHQTDTGLLRIRTDLSPAPARFVQQPPPVHKSNAAVQTLTKTEQVSTTVPQSLPQPQFWPYPTGAMPQVVLVPIAAGSTTTTLTREVKEDKKFAHRDYDRYSSDTDSKQGTLIRIKDESAKKPKPIIKQHRRKEVIKKENWETENIERQEKENRTGERPAPVEPAVITPKVTETVSTVEETKRTEEIERKVRAENKKERRERKKKKGGSHERRQHHLTYHDQGGVQAGAIDYPPWTVPFGESKQSPWRQQQAAITSNGYNPSITESYHKQTTTKRVKDAGSDGSFKSRQTKHSDRPRGHDDTHVTNGVYREGYREHQSQDRMHKSYSSNNVYHNDLPENYDDHRPIVEYPPSLQRSDDRHYNHHGSRHLGRYGRKWESEMSGAERDYRDSLLMPMPPPGRNVNEREYREELIPGGHETFSRETKSHAGSRRDDVNSVTHFSQAKQDVSFRREQAADRRY